MPSVPTHVNVLAGATEAVALLNGDPDRQAAPQPLMGLGLLFYSYPSLSVRPLLVLITHTFFVSAGFIWPPSLQELYSCRVLFASRDENVVIDLLRSAGYSCEHASRGSSRNRC